MLYPALLPQARLSRGTVLQGSVSFNKMDVLPQEEQAV